MKRQRGVEELKSTRFLLSFRLEGSMAALQQDAQGSSAQSEASSDVAESGSRDSPHDTDGSLTLGTQSSSSKVTLSTLHNDLTNIAGRLDSLATETRQLAAEMRDSNERTNASMTALTQAIVAQGNRRVQCSIM